MFFIFHDDIQEQVRDPNLPLSKNPLRKDAEDMHERAMFNRNLRRLEQDAKDWRSPAYRAIRSMNFNQKEE